MNTTLNLGWTLVCRKNFPSRTEVADGGGRRGERSRDTSWKPPSRSPWVRTRRDSPPVEERPTSNAHRPPSSNFPGLLYLAAPSLVSSPIAAMLARANARRLPTLVIRFLSTETAAVSGPHPPLPPPPPSAGKHPTAKPTSRSRLNPAPRPAVSHRSQVLAHLPPSFGRNQILPVADSTRALLEAIVARFDAPIRYAFAYGSGVFEQDGYTSSNPTSKDGPMLDFMFAVTHPDHWHSINMNQYPGHYPLGVRTLGSSFVARVEDIPPGVWFNSMVEMNGVVRVSSQPVASTFFGEFAFYCS